MIAEISLGHSLFPSTGIFRCVYSDREWAHRGDLRGRTWNRWTPERRGANPACQVGGRHRVKGSANFGIGPVQQFNIG